jgi:autotransporter passenger strand-loop-strand repeat protein
VQAVLGIASDTTVSSGGIQYVSSGAIADGTVISNGGMEIVGAFATYVGSGTAGATTSDTVVHAGGIEEVLSGGTATSTRIDGGGIEDVLSSGTANDTTIAGGTLELASGSIAGSVAFTKAGGDLRLDYSQGFQGTVAGFASPHGVTEEIDLCDIAFGSTTTLSFTEAGNHLSGTLTVTDGSHTATLTLLGQYSAANFSLSSDGVGGTLIKDPAVTASASIAAPQHA